MLVIIIVSPCDGITEIKMKKIQFCPQRALRVVGEINLHITFSDMI